MSAGKAVLLMNLAISELTEDDRTKDFQDDLEILVNKLSNWIEDREMIMPIDKTTEAMLSHLSGPLKDKIRAKMEAPLAIILSQAEWSAVLGSLQGAMKITEDKDDQKFLDDICEKLSDQMGYISD